MAPINSKEQITLRTGKLKARKFKLEFEKKGANEKIICTSNDLKTKKIAAKPNIKAKSATRLTIKALIAALLACILVYQKLIKR